MSIELRRVRETLRESLRANDYKIVYPRAVANDTTRNIEYTPEALLSSVRQAFRALNVSRVTTDLMHPLPFTDPSMSTHD